MPLPDFNVRLVDSDGVYTPAGGGASGGLTNTELRATAVPVSGPVTDAQLRATAVPVSRTAEKLETTTRTPGWATGQHLATSTTSARTTAITGTEAIVSLSAAGYIRVGDSTVAATAGAGSLYLGAGIPYTVQLTSGQFIAAILGTGTGTASILPVA